MLVAVAGRGAQVYSASRHCFAARDFPLEPPDGSEPEEWSARVVEWVERTAPPAPRDRPSGPIPVFPLSDRLVDVLDRTRALFGSRYRLAIPDGPAAALLLDKARAFEAAEEMGLDVPRWVAVSGSEGLLPSDSLELPVVVRPRRWSSAGSRYFKVRSYAERAELRQGLAEMLADGADVVAQERVPGPDESVEWVVFYRGDGGDGIESVWTACTGRKRRQASPVGGVMVWGESAPIPEAETMARRFADATGFVGLGGLEVKYHGGRRWFIEVNPRLEAIHFLAARAGVDTVAVAYRHLALGQPPAPPPEPRSAAAWVGGAWLSRLGTTRDWRTAALDAAGFAASPRKVMAVWSIRDPLPWFRVTARLGRAMARRILSRSRRAA